MTPEEMNRPIDFLLQYQARMAGKQEQDEELLRQIVVQEKRLSELIVIESGRLDRADERIKLSEERLDRAEREDRTAQARHEAWEKRQEAWQQSHDELMRQIREGMDRIFEIIDGGRRESL